MRGGKLSNDGAQLKESLGCIGLVVELAEKLTVAVYDDRDEVLVGLKGLRSLAGLLVEVLSSLMALGQPPSLAVDNLMEYGWVSNSRKKLWCL
jgi:hypothetical protein